MIKTLDISKKFGNKTIINIFKRQKTMQLRKFKVNGLGNKQAK